MSAFEKTVNKPEDPVNKPEENKLNNKFHLIDEKFKHIQVFVFCGGKCGSTTLEKSLDPHYTTIHIHSNEFFQQWYKVYNYTIFDVMDYNATIYDTIYIIDSYRTPIERKISSFFQNIKSIHMPDYETRKLRDIVTLFNSKPIMELEEYHPINDALLYYKQAIFNTFDFNKKYNLLIYKNIHFIKVRFNDISNWNKILSDIFKKQIIIHSENISSTKKYANIYNNFKKVYYLPPKYFNKLMLDTNFKIYNTLPEQQKYCNAWKAKIL
jgi:hypothetical protein